MPVVSRSNAGGILGALSESVRPQVKPLVCLLDARSPETELQSPKPLQAAACVKDNDDLEIAGTARVALLVKKKRATTCSQITPEGMMSGLQRTSTMSGFQRTASGSERQKKRQAAKRLKQQNDALEEQRNQCECRLIILKMLGFLNAMWLDQSISWFMKTIRDNFVREDKLLPFVPSEAHQILLAGGSMISVATCKP